MFVGKLVSSSLLFRTKHWEDGWQIVFFIGHLLFIDKLVISTEMKLGENFE